MTRSPLFTETDLDTAFSIAAPFAPLTFRHSVHSTRPDTVCFVRSDAICRRIPIQRNRTHGVKWLPFGGRCAKQVHFQAKPDYSFSATDSRPLPFLLNISVFVLSFFSLYFLVISPCANFSWISVSFLSVRKYTMSCVGYITLYHIRLTQNAGRDTICRVIGS